MLAPAARSGSEVRLLETTAGHANRPGVIIVEPPQPGLGLELATALTFRAYLLAKIGVFSLDGGYHISLETFQLGSQVAIADG